MSTAVKKPPLVSESRRSRRVKSLRLKRASPILLDMRLPHLAVLRQASAGAPSMREIARRIDCSTQLLSVFESGERAMGPESTKAYARAIGATVGEVERAFLLEARRYHRRRIAEITARLKQATGRAPRAVLAG